MSGNPAVTRASPGCSGERREGNSTKDAASRDWGAGAAPKNAISSNSNVAPAARHPARCSVVDGKMASRSTCLARVAASVSIGPARTADAREPPDSTKSTAVTRRSSSAGVPSSMNRATRRSDGTWRSGASAHASAPAASTIDTATIVIKAIGERFAHCAARRPAPSNADAPAAPRTIARNRRSNRQRVRTAAISSRMG